MGSILKRIALFLDATCLICLDILHNINITKWSVSKVSKENLIKSSEVMVTFVEVTRDV